jgi:hypothetical protein
LKDSSIVKRRPAGNAWAREAEESPVLEVVARKRLVKTLQAGEDLVFAAAICELRKSAVAV